MKFSCDECSAQYMIADEKVGSRGVKVKCKKCGHIIVVKPSVDTPPAESAAAPAPQDQDGGSFDAMFGSKTGAGAAAGSPFDEPTQAISREQLDDLKAQSGAASSIGDPATDTFGSGLSADPFGAPAGASGPDFGTSAPDFGMEAPDLGSIAGEATAPGGGSNASGGDSAAISDATGGDFDSAFGAAQAQEPAPLEPSGRPPGEKEWYVAIDDSQVGPIDMAEIEQRWDGLELDEDTLAWKAGMADWLPVAEIPELAYLVTERPQQRQQSVASTAAATGLRASVGAAAAGSGLEPVSFGGDASAPESDVSWTPSAASALSSLVQDELTAPAQPEPTPDAGPSPTELGMPQFGAGELFGGDKGSGNGGTQPVPTTATLGAQPPTDPFAGGQSWGVPKPTQSRGVRPIHLALGGMAVVVVALIAVVLVVVLRPQPASVTPSAGVAPGAQPAQPVAALRPGAVSETPTPSPQTPATATGSKKEKPRDKTVRPKKEKPKEKKKSRESAAGSGNIDDIFDAPRKPKGPPPKATLTKADIMKAVKSNIGSLRPCLSAAQRRGELAPGKHTLVLDWRIKPDGSVTGANLKGPSYVLGTSLPGCFKRQMRGWSFPPSNSGAPITNFPLPFTAR